MTRFYEVCAKCGHVGKNKFVNKVFAVAAEDGKAAAEKVRALPRVKHHKSDAIRYVTEIDYERYLEIICINNDDPYFKCKCVQDQHAYTETDIREEPERVTYGKHEICIKDVYCGKKLLRNPKKYMNRLYAYEEEAVWVI